MIYGYTLWIGHLDFYDTPAKISAFSSSVPDESQLTNAHQVGCCVSSEFDEVVFSGDRVRCQGGPLWQQRMKHSNCCDFPRVVRG